MLKFQIKKVIQCSDWDELVTETYGRPYNFQQQDGCKNRGSFEFTVPNEEWSDFKNDTVPEIVNHEEMGVSFRAWLERDPNQLLPNDKEKWALEMWWQRNFYPDINMIINDLYEKGLLEAGEYSINIDW